MLCLSAVPLHSPVSAASSLWHPPSAQPCSTPCHAPRLAPGQAVGLTAGHCQREFARAELGCLFPLAVGTNSWLSPPLPAEFSEDHKNLEQLNCLWDFYFLPDLVGVIQDMLQDGGNGDGQADRQTSSPPPPPHTPHFLGIQALEHKHSWKHFITLYQGVLSVSSSPFWGCSTDWSWHVSSHPSESFSVWLWHGVSPLQVHAPPVESSQTASCTRGKGCESYDVNIQTPASLFADRKEREEH